MDIVPPPSSSSTPPVNLRRSSSQYFTPPSASPKASTSTGSNKVSAAVDFFESRSRPSSPQPVLRKRPSRQSSLTGHSEDVSDKESLHGGVVGGSGGRVTRTSGSEGSPTPVKDSSARRAIVAPQTTPTRPPPRKSISSASRPPPSSAISPPTRLLPRATPPPPSGSAGSVPFPRTVSQGQAGSSRIPRPVRRVSAATKSSSTSLSSGSKTPPRNAPSPNPPSRIPVLSPRSRPRQLSDQTNMVSRSLMDSMPPQRPATSVDMVKANSSPPGSPNTPTAGSRRTSYHLHHSVPNSIPTSPSPSRSSDRRPSSGSMSSPNRRPSGPRQPNPNARLSISSLSSLVSDGSQTREPEGWQGVLSGRVASEATMANQESVPEFDELSVLPSPSSPSRPISEVATPGRSIHITIPQRVTSSNSPETSLRTARPAISPRSTSRGQMPTFASVPNLDDDAAHDDAFMVPMSRPPERPPIDAKRRASKAVVLGEIAPSTRASTISVLSDVSERHPDNSDFMPGQSTSQRPSRVGRRTSQVSSASVPASEGDPSSPHLTDFSDRVPSLPRSSPRIERNRQGLVVDTATASPSSSAVPESPWRLSTAQPSPPIPVKNPMRQLSRPESAMSTRRAVSGSTKAESPITRTPSVFLDSPAEEYDEGVSPGAQSVGSRLPVTAGAKDERYSSDAVRTREVEKQVLGEWGWGGKRKGRIMEAGEMEALILAADKEVEQRLSLEPVPKSPPVASEASLPDLPISSVPTTTMTFSTPTQTPTPTADSGPAPHTPEPIRHHTPSKSPSMPLLGHGSPPSKASRLLGLSPVSHAHLRSGTDPMAGRNRLLPPPMLRSPTSPNISMSAGGGDGSTATARPPSTSLSKRSHLIREIAMTERAYAIDLALLRDAFISRAQQRRPSSHSVAESSANGVSPGGESMRTSMVASQSMETRPTSGYSNGSGGNVPPPASPLPKSPSASAEVGGMSSFFASSASLSPLPVFSPRTSAVGMKMSAPTGKPLNPTDIRAIFLNIDQLASASEDLAADFEKAIGEEEAGPGVAPRDGEGGTDKIGEVFMSHLPRLRPLYTFYCARQSTASVRLVEVQGDSSHSTYLKDRWDQIKPHTHAWNLDSMLIKPVQRITKYPLLFDDLLACTTPVHPDYFSIRSAAEQCRTMAQEIDEAKRRKDLVAGVINKKSGYGNGGSGSGSSKEIKTPGRKVGGGLKLFRNKEKGSTISLANTLSSPSTATLAPGSVSSYAASTATLVPTPSDLLGGVIPQSSFLDYRILVEKLEDAERMVRRVGREVVQYTAAAKEIFVAQIVLTGAWERVVKLDGTDPNDKRLRAFRKIGEALVDGCWAELNLEVKNQIMPALSKLLDCSINPRKVITKRDAKAADYARITQQKDRSRNPDRSVLDSAREFAALHTQLVEELPPFLEGYIRIFDLTVLAFSRAQAKYHSAVSEKVEGYIKTWIPTATPKIGTPRSPLPASRDTIDLSDEPTEALSMSIDTSPTAAQTIVQTWTSAWTPYGNAMDHFRITRPATTRSMADRMADYSDRTGARGHVRTMSNRSGEASPNGSISGRRPDLRHTNSFSSTHRSSADPNIKLPSPANSIRRLGADGGYRSASLLSPATDTANGGQGTGNGDRSDAISVDRQSFGLPRITPSEEGPFVGLGFTPRSRASSLRTSPQLDGLGLGRMTSQVEVVPPTPPQAPEDRTTVYSNDWMESRRGAVQEDDAGEGWRNERVLYQCSVVADFDPSTFGSKRYRKLRFLPVSTGDLIDVFYEVGRIDELPVFPYPEIGVENDGLLVGRKDDGDIGLVICSFLEPIG